MFLAIARMAKHRFVTPADIDGSALSDGTARARTLQSLLQNTTEQLAFALPVYVAALLSTRPAIQAAVPACACAFLLGRLIFFATYSGGAGARALGFALTFYPTVLLLIWQLVLLAASVAG
ncbi:MAPEG family protein [Xanthomonas phaseoli]|uniref:MAPEG family protein n=3 Tax=Xanthomonas TaxID=338 RepID=A0A1V9HGX2_9XANT|nr:MAPEG family protein [Xanthomonas phaseoli]MBO9788020.1 MAPEG family protein [Xanthomonas phaseoli pv. dieffenbachiae]MBO9832299.1 MAPEG family protein [Xanthomonas phaseoli pv. dieffenbachiae]MBO9836427.1 MAPEG family protein [Xanthomonas phaseoli pv. dieffenbachiae]MBO9841563.1 MAPEG family protein [Xanthomonas phaseoli pv. dieffenbachiae]MBO9855093.1 MAPEG family protein [Xanthomonas phaseoli pv. dieffenbachiae]